MFCSRVDERRACKKPKPLSGLRAPKSTVRRAAKGWLRTSHCFSVRCTFSAQLSDSYRMASTSTAPPPPVSLPLRTLQLAAPAHDPTGQAPTVCLGRQGDYFVLVHSTIPDDYTAPLWAVLSVLAQEDPFPGFSLGGKGSGEMFWCATRCEAFSDYAHPF